MGRPETPIDVSGGLVAAFASDLRRLRRQAGSPTYRDMARSALFSSSVLSSAASGRRLPTLQVTLAFVGACGGDPESWRRRWMQVSAGIPSVAAARPDPQRPAARDGLPRPVQLPPRPRGFVARAYEIAQLGVVPGTPVVVHGPFGVGKSEFALHYAHRVAAGMVDGQLYADLAPLPSGTRGAEAVVTAFLPALGVGPEHLPVAAGQQAALYRTLQAERRLVVLLDNVCDEGQVRPLLGETRHCVTIVISRTPLLGLRDVRRVRLGALSRADSIAMIAAAIPDRAEVDRDGCARLAELCGDLPLALDIAVRRLIARPHVPLRRVTDRLAQPGALLGWLRIGDLSLRQSLASAYAQLGEAARGLLLRLTHRTADGPVGPGGGAIGRRPRPPTVDEWVEDDLMDELIEAGMLRPADWPGSVRLDPLVRAFIEELGPIEAVPAAVG
jgi:hypothetical protein